MFDDVYPETFEEFLEWWESFGPEEITDLVEARIAFHNLEYYQQH